MDQDNIVDQQFRWGYFKYEIRKLFIYFSKDIARKNVFKNKLKTFETRTNFDDNPEYNETNEKLDKIYQEKPNGVRIRSKCNWYEHGEKSSNFFLNLEKSSAAQNQIWNILIGNMEVNNQKDFNNESVRQHLPEHDRVSKFPQLSTECEREINECEKCITEKELFEALKSVPNDKSLGNDSLTK